MKILIAPWGNPSGWKEVVYVFKGKSVKSSTSLKILQETINPDRTIIIGLDTLAEKGRNYEEVKKDAEEKIRKYAEKFGLVDYEVIIAPGIGVFPHGVFHGDALDYYYSIIPKISLLLLENSENTLDIHLDLTHGLNYSTILTYRAVKEIVEMFSIFKKVQFRAYNADPSLPTIAKELSINKIEETAPNPVPFTQKIEKGRPLEPINLTDEERKELFKNKLKSVREIDDEELSAFIGTLYNGLPLALFSFYPEVEKLKKIIFEVQNVYNEYVGIRIQNKLEIVKKIKFGKDFKVYVLAYITAMLLKKLNLISTRRKEVSLDDIEGLKNDLFKFDERVKIRIEDDIYTLKKDLKGKNVVDWRIYNEVLEKSVGEPNLRNFLAHSGFERNVIEIKKDNGKVLLRYREDKIITIAQFCQRGLR